MAKRKMPAQLKKHAFKAGGTKAAKAGAKCGRKSPSTGKSSSTGTAMPPKPGAKKTTKTKGGKRAATKRTKKS
jgi:hypothetical protein